MPRPKEKIYLRLPAHEVKICLRVREARLGLNLSQEEFARQCGINRSRLASYEDARAPIRALFALKICHQFIISERWLATGCGYLGENSWKEIRFSEPASRMCMNLLEDESSSKLKRSALFSTAYGDFLELKYWAASEESGLNTHVSISAQDDIGRLKNILQVILSSWIGIGGVEDSKRLHIGVIRAGYILADEIARKQYGKERKTAFEMLLSLIETNPRAFEREIVDVKNLETTWIASLFTHSSNLTDNSLKGNSTDVKSELEKLIARIKRLASRPGAKTELARVLKVAPARVTEWLTDDVKKRKEPGGHYTLELLKWVEQQERQK